MRSESVESGKRYLFQAGFGLALLGLTILVAACARAPSPAESQSVVAPAAEEIFEPEAPQAQATAIYTDGDSSVDNLLANASDQVQQQRVIIYSGDLSLVVQDTRKAVKAITSLADEQGGYVSGSNVYQSNDVPRGSITIRVPAESYQATLAKLRDLAVRVERENTSTQDVTEEFTDLEARKANLETTETALRELLEERQRVGKTSDILEVYRELTDIRGQIEQIEGRMRYLANQSALSTITIELIPDVLYQPVSVAGWEPQGVAKEALQALVVALQGLANLTIWLVILVLPLLIIMLIPVVVLFWFIRWWWKRRQAKKASSRPSQEKEVSPEPGH